MSTWVSFHCILNADSSAHPCTEMPSLTSKHHAASKQMAVAGPVSLLPAGILRDPSPKALWSRASHRATPAAHNAKASGPTLAAQSTLPTSDLPFAGDCKARLRCHSCRHRECNTQQDIQCIRYFRSSGLWADICQQRKLCKKGGCWC